MAQFVWEQDVDLVQQVRELREDYERALDAAESRSVAYHEAVLGLLEQGGGSNLQEFAEELSLTHQPLHQRVTRKPPRRRNLARAAVGSFGALFLLAAALGGLRLVQAPPFVPYVKVPRVMQMPEAAAVSQLRDAGLNVRVLHLRRHLPRSLFHRVLGVSSAANEQLAKGSTVTLYVAIPPITGGSSGGAGAKTTVRR